MVERIERDLFAPSNHLDGNYDEKGGASNTKPVDATIQEQEDEDESSASSQTLQQIDEVDSSSSSSSASEEVEKEKANEDKAVRSSYSSIGSFLAGKNGGKKEEQLMSKQGNN